MKKIFNLFAIVIVFSSTLLVGCGPDGGGDDPKPQTETITKSGMISEDETWTADKIYLLANKVVVSDGATLTIEPGTIIKGQTGSGSLASALIVAQGGKINAAGTKENPIIFTSILDNIEVGQKSGTNLTENDREKWGGVIILGKAPISAEDGDNLAQIEGIPADDAFGAYGGSDPADNSGTFTYVSIRHGGALIGEGNEINGLTLGGVGTGTTIHHVEVVGTLDDGMECFGGTVNISHAIVAFQGDDGIDLDMNYSGTIDNFIVIHGGDTDEGLEIDGPEGSTYTDGLFTLKNGTIRSTDGAGSAADLKSKAQGTIENCTFSGYTNWVKVRANFDADNSCAVKSDAWKYITDATAKLILKDNQFVGASDVATAVNAYTAVEACEGSLDASAQTALDVAIAAGNNTAPASASGGANTSEFDTWSWTAINGKIN
ncbi:hypothetical protein GYB22_09995 [bacterium]|nr:hypothetical protein [bacterium]